MVEVETVYVKGNSYHGRPMKKGGSPAKGVPPNRPGSSRVRVLRSNPRKVYSSTVPRASIGVK